MNLSTDMLFGIFLIVLGVVLWLSVRFMLKSLFSERQTKITGFSDLVNKANDNLSEAIIQLLPGGKILSINRNAYSIFGVEEDPPVTLNSLAKNVEPESLFYQVCSQPDTVELSIQAKNYQAMSYMLPERTLLFIRPIGNQIERQETQRNTVTSELSAGLSHALTISLDPELLVLNVLTQMKEFILADQVEINLLNDEATHLIPFRIQTGKNGEKPFRAESKEKIGEGFSGKIIQSSEAVWVRDLREYESTLHEIEEQTSDFKSFMGFPLIVDHEVLGTLEFYSNRLDGFKDNQRESVEKVLPQITAALNNAILYRVEKHKAEELKSLAHLAQSASYSRDPYDIFERMLNTISPLISVEIIGFLLFDESKLMLEAQRPFVGLPGPFVEIFKTTIIQGSQAEKIIRSHDVLLTENAEMDFHWITLGLDHIARAASIRESVLIPLISGGEIFGFLMAGNHKAKPAAFSQMEMRLLLIVANQAAPLIENMLLIQQLNRKARLAEVLRKIAVFANSGTSLEQIFSYSLEQLAELFNADCSALFLLENNASQLALQNGSLFGCVGESAFDSILPIQDDQYPFTTTNSLKSIVIGRFDESEPIVPFYQKLVDKWHLLSAMIVPLIIEDEGIGELWVGSGKANLFDFGDIPSLLPVAQLLSEVIEQSKHGDQSQVQWKKKVERLTVAARVNREILNSQDINTILQIIAQEEMHIVNAHAFSWVIIKQDNSNNKSLMILIEKGEKLTSEIRGSLATLIAQGKRVFGQDEDLLIGENRATIFYPFELGNSYFGGLFLYTNQKKGFTQADLDSVQSFISQVHQALITTFNAWEQQNTLEFMKSKMDLQKRLFSISQRHGSELAIQSVLDPIVAELMGFFTFREVSIYKFSRDDHGYKQLYCHTADDMNEIATNSDLIDWQTVELLKKPQYRRENFYQYQSSELPDIFSRRCSEEENKPLDLLFNPIADFDTNPAGLVCLGVDHGVQITDSTLELLQVFIDQIGLILENDASYQVFDFETNEDFEKEKVTDATLETIQPVESLMESSRFQQLFGDSLFEDLLRMEDTKLFFSNFIKAIITKTEFDRVILFIENPDGSVCVQESSSAEIDPNRLNALLGQRNPIQAVLNNWAPQTYPSHEIEGDWKRDPFFHELMADDYLFLPWQISSKKRAVLLMMRNGKISPLSEKQIASFLEKLKLIGFLLDYRTEKEQQSIQLNEINDLNQFEQLTNSLNPEEILGQLLQTSFEQVPVAQAGWVGIWLESDQALKPVLAKGYRNSAALLRIRFTSAVWAIPSIVMEKREVLQINDLNFAANYPLLPEDLVHYQTATGGPLPIGNLIAPLYFKDRNLGILVLENFDGSSKFSNKDTGKVAAMAQQTSKTLHNAYLYRDSLLISENLENQRDQLLLRLSIIAATAGEKDLETNITTALDQMSDAIHAEMAMLFNSDTKKLYQCARDTNNKNAEATSLSLELLQSIGESLIGNDETLILDEIYKNEKWLEKISSDFPYLSLISIPLQYSGENLAVLLFAHSEPFHFSKSDQQLLESIAPQLSQLIVQTNLKDQLRQQQNRLAEAEVEKIDISSRSLAVLEALKDGVIICNPSNEITFSNHVVEKILDLPYASIQNLSIEELAEKSKGSLDKWKNSIFQWANNAAFLNVGQQYSERIHLASQRIIAVQASPVLWNSQYLGAVTMLRDMTVEAQVDRIKTEFIANVSHELRTPLTSIKGYIDIMLMGAAGEISDQQKRFLTVIKNNSARLNVLVDDLLDVANIENDRIRFDLRAVYLDKILSQLIKDYQSRSEQENKTLKFDVKIPKNLRPVRADAQRVKQILSILLKNSYQYSQSGGKVIVRVSQSTSETQIDIQDFGIGIKKEYQDHIFERFFRGEDELVLATSGTGLGLAVAKSLVEMQGGQIWFYSSGIKNEGSLFSFTIPIYMQENG
ncbi:MAG: hypothetical protein BGO78_03550 [Chloroflexi bacterium 44-23]|nr:MAG: hypothetical protein BGO78_03550 [Chloroflexi bacterium 44-23]